MKRYPQIIAITLALFGISISVFAINHNNEEKSYTGACSVLEIISDQDTYCKNFETAVRYLYVTGSSFAEVSDKLKEAGSGKKLSVFTIAAGGHLVVKTVRLQKGNGDCFARWHYFGIGEHPNEARSMADREHNLYGGEVTTTWETTLFTGETKKKNQEKKEAEIAETKKKEQEKKEAEIKKKEQEKKKNESANAESQKATQNKTNTSKSEDDFWGGNQSSNKSNSNTTSGGGTSQSYSRPQEQPVKTQQQINQENSDKFFKEQKRIAEQNEAKRAAVQQAVDQKVQNIQELIMNVGSENQRLNDQINTSYYRINKMATFEPTNRYRSVEQINADYNSKKQFIYSEINKNRELERQKRNNINNYYQRNGDDFEKSAAGFYTAVSSMSDDRSARLEKEKYNAELKAERDKKIAEFEKAQWDALIKNRNGLINGYPDGGVPLSSTKINQQQLYYFSYYFNKLSINEKNPEVVISNVFFVKRYGDGTWPFKNAILDDLKKISGKNQITLVGFYTSEAEASKMRELFLYNSTSCSFKVMEFSYNRKNGSTSNSAANSSDFWGDSKKPTPVNTPESEQSKPVKKDDFWD
jgi:hypothetical protein